MFITCDKCGSGVNVDSNVKRPFKYICFNCKWQMIMKGDVDLSSQNSYQEGKAFADGFLKAISE